MQRHHFVPKFYLRRFVDPQAARRGRQTLWVYRYGAALPEPQSVKNVAYGDDYNLLQRDDGATSDVIERQLFGGLETALGQLLPYLGHPDLILTPEEYEIVCQFVAAMYLRGPMSRLLRIGAVRAGADARLTTLMRRFDHVTAAERASLPIIQEIVALSNPATRSTDAELSQNLHLLWMIDELPDLAKILAKMQWSYFIAPLERPFVTSDTPVVLDGRIDRSDRLTDFTAPDAEVIFPLGPRVCLVLSWQRQPGYYGGTSEQIMALNHRIAMHAYSEVYASSRAVPWIDGWFLMTGEVKPEDG